MVGFAHSGWGLETKSRDLPNYEMPAFDGIGANEYIVDVTHPGAVDFISAVDTPYPWELNIWYHTLNVGFRTRISGETDFPCITDERVGAGRTYAKLDRLTYRGWLDAVRDGRTYVSDGFTHLMDFTVNGVAVGQRLRRGRAAPRGGTAHVTVQVAALLDPVPDTRLRDRPPDEKPYWTIERARVGDSREIPVELVVNGQAGCPHDRARRRRAAAGRFDVPLPVERLDGRAGARRRPHQPDLRHRRRQADPRVAAERGVVPRRGRSVLDAEGREHPARRARGRGARLRPRAGGVPAPDRGIDTALTRYPLSVVAFAERSRSIRRLSRRSRRSTVTDTVTDNGSSV